ncbi:hypothetical protein ALC62_15376, partial [Cyphomyrmex costatus]
SIIKLTEYLIVKRDYKYVLTSRFTQDCVENLFSGIRAKHQIPNALLYNIAGYIIHNIVKGNAVICNSCLDSVGCKNYTGIRYSRLVHLKSYIHMSSRSGRPIEAATPEIIDKVHDIVLTDRRVKVRELVEATGISHGTVISILQELRNKNESMRWKKYIDSEGDYFED